MHHDLEQTISLLARTPATLDALLRDLPETWTSRNEGDNTMNASEVVAHLAYGDRVDWMPRAKIILEFGETHPFDPFDRAGHLRDIEGKSLPQVLDEFSSIRRERLAELAALNLSADDLEKRGRHPALGIVTLSQLLSAWAAHDLTHLHQISRVLAHQYREAVGPFGQYLGVMKCDGHSS